jgi:hypothetical protein
MQIVAFFTCMYFLWHSVTSLTTIYKPVNLIASIDLTKQPVVYTSIVIPKQPFEYIAT